MTRTFTLFLIVLFVTHLAQAEQRITLEVAAMNFTQVTKTVVYLTDENGNILDETLYLPSDLEDGLHYAYVDEESDDIRNITVMNIYFLDYLGIDQYAFKAVTLADVHDETILGYVQQLVLRYHDPTQDWVRVTIHGAPEISRLNSGSPPIGDYLKLKKMRNHEYIRTKINKPIHEPSLLVFESMDADEARYLSIPSTSPYELDTVWDKLSSDLTANTFELPLYSYWAANVYQKFEERTNMLYSNIEPSSSTKALSILHPTSIKTSSLWGDFGTCYNQAFVRLHGPANQVTTDDILVKELVDETRLFRYEDVAQDLTLTVDGAFDLVLFYFNHDGHYIDNLGGIHAFAFGTGRDSITYETSSWVMIAPNTGEIAVSFPRLTIQQLTGDLRQIKDILGEMRLVDAEFIQYVSTAADPFFYDLYNQNYVSVNYFHTFGYLEVPFGISPLLNRIFQPNNAVSSLDKNSFPCHRAFAGTRANRLYLPIGQPLRSR